MQLSEKWIIPKLLSINVPIALTDSIVIPKVLCYQQYITLNINWTLPKVLDNYWWIPRKQEDKPLDKSLDKPVENSDPYYINVIEKYPKYNVIGYIDKNIQLSFSNSFNQEYLEIQNKNLTDLYRITKFQPPKLMNMRSLRSPNKRI